MKITENIAKHLREVYFGGNWTSICLKDTLEDVPWKEATTKLDDLNTIATLVNHMAYYAIGVSKVLEGGKLETKDALSFEHPPIRSQEDWEIFLQQIWYDANAFADLIEQLPDSILHEHFVDKKYGIYYRNLSGIIEHLHYHLGQIVVLKKIIKGRNPESLIE